MIVIEYLKSRLSRKVPEVILLFWVIKLFSTALGESTSDYLVHTINPIIAVIIGGIGLTVSMAFQFLVKKYVPWIYWLAVTMVAIFGTMAADVIHIVFGVPYFYSTIFFCILLGAVFLVWYKVEKTLSIHSIYTPMREIFYWMTVITTFALGTAAGDMTAVTLGLGYLASGILFGLFFALPFVIRRFFNLNEVFAFWFAYIVTRPLGASFADWFGRTKDFGGLGVGTGPVSAVLAILIFCSVLFLIITHKDIKKVK